MYLKEDYKKEMKKIIKEHGYDPIKIARVTFRIFIKNSRDLDENFYDKLIDVFTMEDGPEFEMTEEEFNKFLDEM